AGRHDGWHATLIRASPRAIVDPHIPRSLESVSVRRTPSNLAILLLVCSFPVTARSGGDARCTESCRARTATCIQTTCGGLRGPSRRACLERCRGAGGCTAGGALRTLAYVMSECRELAEGLRGHQALHIRRGNCDPVTVMEVGSDTILPDP